MTTDPAHETRIENFHSAVQLLVEKRVVILITESLQKVLKVAK